MIVATDFDGVIFDFKNMLESGLKNKYNLDISNCWKDGYYIKVKDTPDEKLAEMILRTIKEDTIKGSPIKDSLECLKKLSDFFSCPIHIITARKEDLANEAEKWLEMHTKELGLKYVFSYYDTTKQKRSQFFHKDTRYYIDDQTVNILDILSDTNNIRYCFLLKQIYNENDLIPEEFIKKIHVADNWSEIHHYLYYILK